MPPLILKDEITQSLNYPPELIPSFLLVCFAVSSEDRNRPEDWSDPPIGAAGLAGKDALNELAPIEPGDLVPSDILKNPVVRVACFSIPPAAGHIDAVRLRLRFGNPVEIIALAAGTKTEGGKKKTPFLRPLAEIDPEFFAKNSNNTVAVALMGQVHGLMSTLILLLKGIESGQLLAPADEIGRELSRLIVLSMRRAMRLIYLVGGDPLAWLRAEIEFGRNKTGKDNDMVRGLTLELNALAEAQPWLNDREDEADAESSGLPEEGPNPAGG